MKIHLRHRQSKIMETYDVCTQIWIPFRLAYDQNTIAKYRKAHGQVLESKRREREREREGNQIFVTIW